MNAILPVARHFASPLNERGISRAWSDEGIDRKAAEPQADKVAKWLSGLGVTEIESSDLPRAQQSAEMVAEKMDGDIKVTAKGSLKTWNTGMEGKAEKDTLPLRQKYIKNPETKPPGKAEEFQGFLDRFCPLPLEILRHNASHPDAPKAMVLHGHQMLALPHAVTGEDVDEEKLTTLDEDSPPGSMVLVRVQGDRVTFEKVGADKSEAKKAVSRAAPPMTASSRATEA